MYVEDLVGTGVTGKEAHCVMQGLFLCQEYKRERSGLEKVQYMGAVNVEIFIPLGTESGASQMLGQCAPPLSHSPSPF